MFSYSPNKGSILENIQEIYGKNLYKMIKAVVTRSLTQKQDSKQALDRLTELLETLDQICRET